MNQRRSIEVPGLGHDNPIPAASRIGPFLVTSVITGKDPQTGEIPAGIEEQCAVMFANIRRVLDAAGGKPEDILKLTVWMKDRSMRVHMNKEWVAMFPDPHSRPARHTFASSDPAGAMLVQCEFMAVLGDHTT
jgi:enamine deaminase RidA (YjgF/YER057c/UK114 family)